MININAEFPDRLLPKYLGELAFRKLPPTVVEALKSFPEKLVLAGGFFRALCSGEKINDIDLFATDRQTANDVLNRISLAGPVSVTDQAFTLTEFNPAVQVIFGFPYTEPEQVIDCFDLTIAQASLWFDAAGRVQTRAHPDFENDVLGQRLVYTSPIGQDPMKALLRLFKFSKMGYGPNKTTLALVMAECLRGMHPETLLGTESNLVETLIKRMPNTARS